MEWFHHKIGWFNWLLWLAQRSDIFISWKIKSVTLKCPVEIEVFLILRIFCQPYNLISFVSSKTSSRRNRMILKHLLSFMCHLIYKILIFVPSIRANTEHGMQLLHNIQLTDSSNSTPSLFLKTETGISINKNYTYFIRLYSKLSFHVTRWLAKRVREKRGSRHTAVVLPYFRLS